MSSPGSEAAFLAAALPEPVVLLGQRLEPYSIGHELLLRRHKCPFLDFDLPAGESVENHLFMAVFICSQRYEHAIIGLRNPKLPEEIAQWRKRIGEMPAPLVLEKIKLFQEYVKTGSSFPHVKTRSKFQSSTPLGGPWLAALIAGLLGRLHFGSYQDVMNCPYGLGQWLFCVWWEREGALTIRTQSEEEEIAAVRAAAAKLGLEMIRRDG